MLILFIVRVGLERCWMVRIGVTLGCVIFRSSICCFLVSYLLKNKKIYSIGKFG